MSGLWLLVTGYFLIGVIFAMCYSREGDWLDYFITCIIGWPLIIALLVVHKIAECLEQLWYLLNL
jgi:uncharacterized membrane protein